MKLLICLSALLTLIPIHLAASEGPLGIVAYKKSPSHPDQNAKIQTFRSYEYSDPRYLFFTGNGAIEVTRFQGPAIYLLQSPSEMAEIQPSQLLGMKTQLSAAKSFIARFNEAKPLLKSEIADLQKVIQRLELGQHKVDDLWLTEQDAQTYLTERGPDEVAAARETRLKAEILKQRQRLADAKRSVAMARTNLHLLELELKEHRNLQDTQKPAKP